MVIGSTHTTTDAPLLFFRCFFGHCVGLVWALFGALFATRSSCRHLVHLVSLRPTSYRRRIVAQRKKQTKDPDNEKRNELLVTLENKLVAAEANFNSVDVVLRREMQWVIDNKHNLVHKQMVMCMCCYSEFYKRANAEFVNVVQNIPEGN